MKAFVCAFLWLLAGVGTAAAQSNQSIYTSLSAKQCRTACRGVTGYSLRLSEDDLRQNITVITPAGAKHSLELWDVISGGFSSVSPKVEWRMTMLNGKLSPIALIVRYNASEDPAAPNKLSSYLAVSKITPAEICVTDKIPPGPKANDDARRAADTAATKPCLKARN